MSINIQSLASKIDESKLLHTFGNEIKSGSLSLSSTLTVEKAAQFFGFVSHSNDVNYYGTENHYGDEIHNGYVSHMGYEYFRGTEDHAGNENHFGNEKHTGIEIHLGDEHHGGIERHNNLSSFIFLNIEQNNADLEPFTSGDQRGLLIHKIEDYKSKLMFLRQNGENIFEWINLIPSI